MKRFLALAWRKSADEKIPLSAKNCVADNGAIPKLTPSKQLAKMAEKEKMASGKGADPDVPSPECEPMSLLRKFAMFLSLNVIALYFVAFAWLIPCTLLNCQFGQEWTVYLDNISISTNLEVSGPPSSELLIFGYLGENEDSKGVIALVSSTGSVKWKISLDHNPVYCRCNVTDVDGDGVLDCLIFSEAHLHGLNASNGYVFWIQEFKAISSLFVTINGCDDSEWIVLVEDQGFLTGHGSDQEQKRRISMIILDKKNSTVVKDLPLHCDSFPKQLVTWKSKTNVTQIAFQCSYNSSTEVQLISEEDLCSLVFGRSAPKMRSLPTLFSFGSSTAVDDVFLLPVSHVGLVVGWSTMVAVATDATRPPRLLWQSRPGSIRSAIKFVLGGYFTSRQSTQIAIVIHNGFSTLVKVVDLLDGQEVASVELGRGPVSSVLSVSRTKKNNDSLLIIKEGRISSAPNRTASDFIDFTTENAFLPNTADLPRQKAYLLLTFGKENNVTELLTENRRTEMAVKNGDCIAVFLATWISNQTTRISLRDLKGLSSKSSCPCR